MSTPEAFVATARSFIGTPYHHEGRVPNRLAEDGTLIRGGLDCFGVVVCAAKLEGLVPAYKDRLSYPDQPNGELEEGLDKYLERIPKGMQRLGDVLVFAWHEPLQHLGIYTESRTVIHTTREVGQVTEAGLTGELALSLARVYRLPEFV